MPKSRALRRIDRVPGSGTRNVAVTGVGAGGTVIETPNHQHDIYTTDGEVNALITTALTNIGLSSGQWQTNGASATIDVKYAIGDSTLAIVNSDATYDVNVTIDGDLTTGGLLTIPNVNYSGTTFHIDGDDAGDTNVYFRNTGAGNSNVDIDGNLTVAGSLNVTGSVGFDEVTITGAITDYITIRPDDFDQAYIYLPNANDTTLWIMNTLGGSADLYVQDDVTVGGLLTVPDINYSNTTFHIDGNSASDTTVYFRNTGAGNSNVDIDGDLSTGGDLSATGSATFANDITVTGSVVASEVSTSGTSLYLSASNASNSTVYIRNTLAGTASLNVDGGATVGGNLSVAGTTSLTDDLSVNSGVLFVDASADRIGVNDTTPSYSLDINGTLRATGAAYLNSTLSTTGAATFADDLTVDTDTLFVDASADTVNVAGTLDVNGIFTLPHWQIDADGEIRSTNPAYSAQKQGVLLTPAGVFEAQNVDIRGQIRAAVLSYEETVIHAGSDLWTPGGGATLATDLTTGAAGAEVTFDIKDGQVSTSPRALVGDYLRIKSVSLTTGTEYTGYSPFAAAWDISPVIAYAPTGGFVTIDLWMEVTAYERNAADDGYTYTCDVISNTAPGATVKAGAGIANYLDVVSPPYELGYIHAVANDNASPRIEIGRIGGEPWNGEEYPTVVIGKLDMPVYRSKRHGLLIAQNAMDSTSPYIAMDSANSAIVNVPLTISDGTPAVSINSAGLRIDSSYYFGVTNSGDPVPGNDTTPRRIEFVRGLGDTDTIVGWIGSYTKLTPALQPDSSRLDIVSGSGSGIPGAIYMGALTSGGAVGARLSLDNQTIKATGALVVVGEWAGSVDIEARDWSWITPRSGTSAAGAGDIYAEGGFLRIRAETDTGVTFDSATTFNALASFGSNAWINNSTGNAYFAGNVGIGVSTSTSPLRLVDTNAARDTLLIENTAAGTGARAGIKITGDGGFGTILYRSASSTFVPDVFQVASSGGDITFNPGNGATELLRLGTDGTIRPGTDNLRDLGTASYRFDDVYATNGTIQTSDQRLKSAIADSDLGLDFIQSLRPVSFKRTGGKRTHYGLIAQEVEAILAGRDFAGLIYNAEADRYGLRYDEFIGPLIKAVQQLAARLDALEAA